MSKKIAALALAAVVLTGCQSHPVPGLPTMATAGAAIAPTETSLKTLSGSQMRRLMNVGGDSAALWGVSYSLIVQQVKVTTSTQYQGTNGKWKTRKTTARVTEFRPNLNFSGKNAPAKVSYDRYVYTVPQGQVLVLNNIEGEGRILVNGFPIATSPNSYGLQKRLNYLFGPGEEVVLLFRPDHDYKASRAINNGSAYKTVVISGFTVSPSLLGATGALAGGK